MAIALESRAHYFRAGVSWNLIPTSLLSGGRSRDCRGGERGDPYQGGTEERCLRPL